MTDQQLSETTQDESTDEQSVATVPRQSVDTSLTVGDRLTRNVREQIGPARYFARDDDGEPTENWADVFDRVATNVAQAEALTDPDATDNQVQYWSTQFRSAINDLRFVPNSPTLMNAGEPLQQLSACFLRSPKDSMDDINQAQSDAAAIFKCLTNDTLVTTDNGTVTIDAVDVGDTIVQRDGTGRVTETHTYEDTEVFEVTFENGTSITGTPNHELFTTDGETRIDELSPGDEVQAELNWLTDDSAPTLETVPQTLWETNDNPELHKAIVEGVEAEKSDYEIASEVPQSVSTVQRHRKDVLDIDAVGTGGRSYEGGYESNHAAGRNDVSQPEHLTDELAWLVGLWVGDGSYHNDGIRFHLSSEPVIERARDAVKFLFDLEPSISPSEGCIEFGVYSSAVKRFWETNFGEGKPSCQNAKIPEKIWQGSRDHSISFLRGLYDADGTLQEGEYPSLTSVSDELVSDVAQMLQGLGIEARIWRGDRNNQARPAGDGIDRFIDLIGVNDDYTVERELDTTEPQTSTVLEVDNVSDAGTETVYDVTVEGDHEYIASTVRSHNSGGGVGYAFHHLRPKGARVESTGGVSSGPLSFMELYDTTCGTVKQGGKRRGAQMAIMHAHHPDIGRFAVSKRGEDSYTNFNISYGLTDDLRDAVEADETITMYDPRTRPTSDHDLRAGEAFAVVPETAHFYDPQFEDAWNEQFDKPGLGLDGKPVEENFWRDYADQMATDFSEWRDQIDLEVGEPLELPAGFLWQLLVDGAWNNGEPGMFHIDEVNREHSFDPDVHPDQRIHASNPCCVTGDTKVHTDDGLVPIAELAESGEPDGVVTDERLGGQQIESCSNAYVTGEDDVYELTTEEGYSVRLTDDHPIRTDNGWVEVADLSPGDEIHVLSHSGAFGEHGTEELGEVLGWLVGDGHCKHGEQRAVLNFYGKDTGVVSDRLTDAVNTVVRESDRDRDYEIEANEIDRSNSEQGASVREERIRSSRLYELASEYGLTDEKLQVPDRLFTGSRSCVSGFLRALFAADGSVQGSAAKGISIRLATVSLDLAHDVQELLSNFGIYSRVYENRADAGTRELPDGHGGTAEYETQANHEVVISSGDVVTFNEQIGFLHEYKQDALDSKLTEYARGPRERTFTATIESIEYDGTETVYDLTESTTHSFVANGIVVHNSEQPLNEYEACNLGHVNLSLMVDETAPMFDEFVERYDADPIELVDSYLNRAIDHDTFSETVRTGTRFLDNVVTMSDFPIEEIEQEVGRKRKIGLGLMGFHQMLIQMGVEYGTDVSYEFAREIMRRIDQGATEMSHELAEQRGVFPAYEQSKWANPTEYPEWFETHAHRDPDDHEDGFPVRNHNMTTIAPTGTTSMIGNTTGGCEPLYQVAFFKNVGDDIQGDEMLVEFDDFFLQTVDENGIDTEQVKQEAKELMLNNEFDDPADIPSVPDDIGELFVTTQDLAGEQHIRMQAAFQEYCDSGISKTLNMPNDATVEEVGESLKLAVDLGIKGTTVYRTGSRDEQVKTTRVDNNLDDELSDEQLLAEVVERFTDGVETEPSAIDIDAEVTVQNIADELTVEGVEVGRTE